MKRIISVFLLTLLLLSLIGCNKENPTSQNSNPSAQEEVVIEVSRTDAYRRNKRQLAVADNNDDIYIMSHTEMCKINRTDGKVETLLDGFEFGHDIALHDQYIYYQIGTTLYRMDKTSHNIETCQLNLESHLLYVCFEIIDDTIIISAYNEKNEMKIEYLYSDVSNNPTTFSFTSESNLDFKRYDDEKENIRSLLKSTNDYSRELQLVDATDKFIYFAASSMTKSGPHKLGRIAIETYDIEILEIFPLQTERTTIINGWIYYQERNEKNIIEFKRTSEDLSLTEKILESPMSQVRLE